MIIWADSTDPGPATIDTSEPIRVEGVVGSSSIIPVPVKVPLVAPEPAVPPIVTPVSVPEAVIISSSFLEIR